MAAAAASPVARAAGDDMQSRLEKAVHAYYYGSREEALQLLRPLAEAGCAKAQVKLTSVYAMMAEEGGDTRRVVKWTKRAAEKGNAQAQLLLGFSYDFGETGLGPRDYKNALKWYRRAAEQGEPHAMDELARMYLAGRGVEHDPVEGYKWLLLAIPRYPPSTKEPAHGVGFDNTERAGATAYRDGLRQHLTTLVITLAKGRAKAWEKAHDYIHRMPETSDKPLPLWYDRIKGGCDD
ncbi:MAG TPA: tetratricopeptide repeat protein, partial [Gammaproteobacteria bacterium]|nr:tetratricopeptide repeat protein [Gammaproteobacteria bacterium]